MPSPNVMPREEMDELVADAVTSFPDAKLDESVLNNLALAQELKELAEAATPLMIETVEHMMAKMQNRQPLRLLEVGLCVLTPRIDAGLTPRIPMVAALFSAMCSALLGLRYLKENPDQRGPNLNGRQYEAFLDENLNEVLTFVMSMPKKEFLEAVISLLKKHITHLNGSGATE